MARRIRLILWSAAVLIIVIGALSLAGGGYLGELASRITETGAPRPVHDLNSIGQLQDAFNAGTGTPRLILLVSPT